MDRYAGKVVDGECVGGEFVRRGDAEGREPGVYLTIKVDDRVAIVGGPVRITYLPLNASATADSPSEARGVTSETSEAPPLSEGGE